MTIDQRAASALERIKAGLAPMRIPADPTDPDLVITDLLAELNGMRQAEAAAKRERDDLRRQVEGLSQTNRELGAAAERLETEVTLAKGEAEMAEHDRDTALATAAVFRQQLENWVGGGRPFEATEKALAASAELAEAFVEHLHERWEGQIIAALQGGENLDAPVTVSKAFADALGASFDRSNGDERARGDKLQVALAELRALLFDKTGKPGPRDQPWERDAWRIIEEALAQ